MFSKFTFFLVGVAAFVWLGVGFDGQEKQISALAKPGGPKGSDTTSAPKESALDQAAKADLITLVQGNNEFAFDLYRRLSKKEGNLIFSPYSISNALAMTYAGARGETARQMAKVLHFTLLEDRQHLAFAELISQLQPEVKDRPFQLSVANALWGQQGHPLQEQFLKLSNSCYGAGLKELDFARDAEGSRQKINDWVKSQTKDRIKELIGSELSPNTKLVLTNAVYLKASWQYQFPKEATKDAPFHVGNENTMSVPMMTVGFYPFNYYSDADLQLVELPYEGERFAMLVLLPNKWATLEAIERSLTASRIDTAVSKLKMHLGVVALPRFKVTLRFRLEDALIAMGMPAPFSSTADFTGMAPGGGLRMSFVVHQAFIDVDEHGTEAAAATAVGVVDRALPQFSLTADRPFLFFIRDNQTGTILFLARVMQPL